GREPAGSLPGFSPAVPWQSIAVFHFVGGSPARDVPQEEGDGQEYGAGNPSLLADRVVRNRDPGDDQDGDHHADQGFAGDQPGGEEDAGVIAKTPQALVFGKEVDQPADRAADDDRGAHMDGQVDTDGHYQGIESQKFDDDGDGCTEEDQVPSHVALHHAFDDRFHQHRLRSEELLGAHFIGLIQDDQDGADHEAGGDHADHHGELLFPGRSADEVSRLQVLGNVPGHGQGGTHHGAHRQSRHHAVQAAHAGDFKQEGDDQDGGDRHARNRRRGASDNPDDAGGDGHEQKTEDGDGKGADHAHVGDRGEGQNDDDDQYAQSDPLQGDVLVGANQGLSAEPVFPGAAG